MESLLTVVKCDCTQSGNCKSNLVSYGILSQPLLLPLSSGYLPIIKDCSETASSAMHNNSLKILEFINVIVGNLCLSEQPN